MSSEKYKLIADNLKIEERAYINEKYLDDVDEVGNLQWCFINCTYNSERSVA